MGFLWSSFGDIFDRVFCLIFKMEFNTLPDLLNTGFTIIEIGLFYVGENIREQKYADRKSVV